MRTHIRPPHHALTLATKDHNGAGPVLSHTAPALPASSAEPATNSYRVKRPGDTGTRSHGPPTIRLVNLPATVMINLG
jgi:hypothetical protein